MMQWEQDFTPAAQQVQPVQDWQNDFTHANQNAPQQDNNLLGTKDQWARQAGLTARDALDITSGSVASGADLLSSGLNSLTGMNALPTNTRNLYEKGLDVWGLPKPQSTSEKIGSGATQIGGSLALGGEGTYNLAKQGYSNLADMLSRSAPEADVATANVVVPTNSDIKLIKQKLEMAGITPQQYAEALKNSSPEDFAGEVGGDPLRMQTQAQAKITSPVMQDARDAMRQRLAMALPRTQSILADALGPQDEIASNLASIEQMKSAEPQLYGAVNGKVPTAQFSGVFETPAGQSALEATKQNLLNKRINLSDAGFLDDGNLSGSIPVNTMHEFTKSLNGQIGRDAFGNVSDPAAAMPIQGLSQDVISQLKLSDPNFAAAQNNAATMRQAQQSFDNARAAARMTAGDKVDTVLQPLSQDPYAVSGFHQGLLDKLSDTPLHGGNPAGTITKQSLIDRVTDLTGSNDKAQQLANALLQEKNRVELAQRGLGGSNTAETLDSGIPKVPNIMELPGHIFNAGKDWVMKGRNERLGQLLYATSPEQKSILAQKVLGK